MCKQKKWQTEKKNVKCDGLNLSEVELHGVDSNASRSQERYSAASERPVEVFKTLDGGSQGKL